MYTIRLLAPAALLVLAHTGAAQELRDANRLPAGDAPPPAALPSAPRLAERAEARGAVSATRSFLHTVGGAAVGAWVGFFTSQVFKSDWAKKTDREVVGYRAGFAAGGAVFGGVGGLAIGRRRANVEPLPVPAMQPKQAREIITVEEIKESGETTVFQLISALRPEWLRMRGIQTLRDGGRFHEGTSQLIVVTPGEDPFLVYLDNARLGSGPGALRQVPVADLGSLEFLSPAEANYKWGVNRPVIWLQSRTPEQT